MSLAAKLQLRQGQTLTMTPQLLQAIKLLQFSAVELNAFIADELERNPLLETDERADDAGISDLSEQSAVPVEGGEEGDFAPDWLREISAESAFDPSAEASDAPVNDLYPDLGPANDMDAAFLSPSKSVTSGAGTDFERGHDIENLDAKELTLPEHLSSQIPDLVRDPKSRMIAHCLVNNLDERGYLDIALDEVANTLSVSLAEVETVLELVQICEPVGVFSRNVAECLTLQLRAKDRFDPAMALFVDNLDLVIRGEHRRLQRICGVDQEDLIEMIGEIRALDPKPGASFQNSRVEVRIADVLVRATHDGGWRVELNPDAVPRLLVNQSYFETVRGQMRNTDDTKYLNTCLQDGRWLVKNLDQRARSILKVASEVVRKQDGFFKYGVHYMRPLTLREVAEEVDLHESTVSRIVANKYISCARGIVEFKYFFSSSISSSVNGVDHSSESVREVIRSLINDEDPKKILSDDKLVQLLGDQNIDIARRTVAKYREAMNIPSSVERRRLKRLHN